MGGMGLNLKQWLKRHPEYYDASMTKYVKDLRKNKKQLEKIEFKHDLRKGFKEVKEHGVLLSSKPLQETQETTKNGKRNPNP